jgi:hypothetical protein
MSQTNRHEKDQMDPRLLEKLELLHPTSPRNPDAAAQGRAKFLAELETLELASTKRNRTGFLAGWLSNQGETRTAYSGRRKARFSFKSAFLVITLLVFLFGGAGMTALAAQSALPGDALYPIKTSMEQAQFTLSTSPSSRVHLQLEFAERRLLEIAGLIDEEQFQEIPAATDQFEAHIRNVLVEVEDVANHDPEQASGLSDQVSKALTRYTFTMSRMLEQVPEAVQVKMMRTIQNTWLAGNVGEILFNGAIDSIGPQAWMISGQAVAIDSATEVRGTFAIGDLVQVRAVRNADGSLSARQIERVLAGMEDSGSADPGDSGAGGPDAGLSGSDEGQDGWSGDPDQTQGQYQNNTQSGSEGSGQFQNQTQDPNFQGPGSGKDDGQDSPQKSGSGRDGSQNPNDKDN